MTIKKAEIKNINPPNPNKLSIVLVNSCAIIHSLLCINLTLAAQATIRKAAPIEPDHAIILADCNSSLPNNDSINNTSIGTEEVLRQKPSCKYGYLPL